MSMEFTTKSRAFLSISWLFVFFITDVSTINPYGADWGVTLINGEVIKYTWTIRNYSLSELEPAESLFSPIFFGGNQDIQWKLRWYTKRPVYCEIYLHLIGRRNTTAKFNVSIVDGNGKLTHTHLVSSHTYSNDNGFGWDNFISHSDLKNKSENLLPDDTLTIYVEILVTNGTTNISGNCRFSNNETEKDERTAKLLESSFLSDVLLKVNDQKINAHRAILASHSSWFYKQFTENPNISTIDIVNTSVSALRHALHFMYAGKIDNNIEPHMDIELLESSNFFGIEQLKLICEERLCKSMTPINATEILMLAELNDAENLKREATNYIAAHTASVLDSPAFQRLEKLHPNPFYMVLRTLVGKSQN